MILGEPQFDASAPALRVQGRKLSNLWANLETLWAGIHDSLFGFRVYPVEPLLRVMRLPAVDAPLRLRRRGRRAPVLARATGRAICRAPVRYFRPDEGGVSHFNYWRDNALLTWMHMRLFAGFLAAPAAAGVAAPAGLKLARADGNPDIMRADSAGPAVHRPWHLRPFRTGDNHPIMSERALPTQTTPQIDALALEQRDRAADRQGT